MTPVVGDPPLGMDAAEGERFDANCVDANLCGWIQKSDRPGGFNDPARPTTRPTTRPTKRTVRFTVTSHGLGELTGCGAIDLTDLLN